VVRAINVPSITYQQKYKRGNCILGDASCCRRAARVGANSIYERLLARAACPFSEHRARGSPALLSPCGAYSSLWHCGARGANIAAARQRPSLARLRRRTRYACLRASAAGAMPFDDSICSSAKTCSRQRLRCLHGTLPARSASPGRLEAQRRHSSASLR